MTTQTVRGVTRQWSLHGVVSWYAVHVRRGELDEILAEGIEPDTPATRRLCEARARLLARQSFRFALAQEIEDVLRLAAIPQAPDPSLRTVWTVDIQLDEVRHASEILQQLATALRARTPPETQGIALAWLLLRDGLSPLYERRASGDLKLAAEAVARALATPPTSTTDTLTPSDTTAASRWWLADPAPGAPST